MAAASRVIGFEAPEHRADGTVAVARYEIGGDSRSGWEVCRESRPHLALGAGYRLLRTRQCGICATDLARHRLPFPLPQVTGHEVVAEDEEGRLVGVEINASHAARRLPRGAWCACCRAGLATHCPERLVLGIHGLLGGFSPWILAPVGAIVPLPADLDPLVATLLEPFAAAWHAVQTIGPARGVTVAVLGVGRLGTLAIAALAAHRRRSGAAFAIVGIAREPVRAGLARLLGADDVWALDAATARGPCADVVVETTGAAAGLGIALRLARREVHLKSTTGEPSCGLRHPTELVVDELRIVPAADRAGARSDLRYVSSLAEIDAAIRPDPGLPRAAVPPRGTLALVLRGEAGAPLLNAVGRRGIRLTTSRCGDLRVALPVLCEIAAASGIERLVTRVLPAARLVEGYALARQAGAGKIVVRQPA